MGIVIETLRYCARPYEISLPLLCDIGSRSENIELYHGVGGQGFLHNRCAIAVPRIFVLSTRGAPAVGARDAEAIVRTTRSRGHPLLLFEYPHYPRRQNYPHANLHVSVNALREKVGKLRQREERRLLARAHRLALCPDAPMDCLPGYSGNCKGETTSLRVK
jgi:hypothetical protein